MRSTIRGFALLLLLSSHARLASGEAFGVPDPRFSTFPSRIRMCPAGDLDQTVTVRDVNNAPLAGVTVELDFCGCPNVKLCPAAPGDQYTIVNGCKVRAVTNTAGIAAFPIHGGGVCADYILLSANGVVLGSLRPTTSPDQDGSGVVDATDAAILATKLGGSDLTGDLDFTGVIDAADQAFLAAHSGHACPNTTPAREATWGRLKVHYR